MLRTLLLVAFVTNVSAFTPTALNRFAKSPLLESSHVMRTPSADLTAMAPKQLQKVGAAGYVAYAIGFAGLLMKTLRAYPLIPPSVNSLMWCRAWLWTTVIDCVHTRQAQH